MGSPDPEGAGNAETPQGDEARKNAKWEMRTQQRQKPLDSW